MLDYDDVPISDGLVDRIRKWQTYYDVNCQDYLMEDEPRWRKFDSVWFNEEAESIYIELVTELKSWAVHWFQETYHYMPEE